MCERSLKHSDNSNITEKITPNKYKQTNSGVHILAVDKKLQDIKQIKMFPT